MRYICPFMAPVKELQCPRNGNCKCAIASLLMRNSVSHFVPYSTSCLTLRFNFDFKRRGQKASRILNTLELKKNQRKSSTNILCFRAVTTNKIIFLTHLSSIHLYSGLEREAKEQNLFLIFNINPPAIGTAIRYCLRTWLHNLFLKRVLFI